jgi:hypothetical protein
MYEPVSKGNLFFYNALQKIFEPVSKRIYFLQCCTEYVSINILGAPRSTMLSKKMF